ncbi:hypothetical protein ACE193_24855 [Bernardetia sp. OM2101]|uniref:hypothetical protein n=1 Tax=Bernardetia sp. OM2101 TaxID=3344876 RepID=UPI0035D036DD
MAIFKLIVQVSPQDREGALKGQKLILTKASQDGSGNTSWVATRPFGVTTISWEQKYGVYASTTEIKEGATINRLSSKPGIGDSGDAKNKMLYNFTDDAIFVEGALSLPNNNYGSKNSYSDLEFLTMGVMQQADVNGTKVMNPINALTVPRGQNYQSEPIEKVTLFASKTIGSETIISKIGTETFDAVYRDGKTEIICHYDNNVGKFVEGPYPNFKVQSNGTSNVELDYTYAFTGLGVCTSLVMLAWVRDNQALIIGQLSGLVSTYFGTFDAASKSFSVIGTSALACAEACKAIQAVINKNYPGGDAHLVHDKSDIIIDTDSCVVKAQTCDLEDDVILDTENGKIETRVLELK